MRRSCIEKAAMLDPRRGAECYAIVTARPRGDLNAAGQLALRRGRGELLHLEAFAAEAGAAAAVLLAGLDRAPVVDARGILEAEAVGGFGQQEVGQVAEVADLQHRDGEVAPVLLLVQGFP